MTCFQFGHKKDKKNDVRRSIDVPEFVKPDVGLCFFLFVPIQHGPIDFFKFGY